MSDVEGNCEIVELNYDEENFIILVERKCRELSINEQDSQYCQLGVDFVSDIHYILEGLINSKEHVLISACLLAKPRRNARDINNL